jgi:hypothetical protein
MTQSIKYGSELKSPLIPLYKRGTQGDFDVFQRGIQGDWKYKNQTETRNFLIAYFRFIISDFRHKLNSQSPFGSPFEN